MSADGWQFGVFNKFERVGGSGVFSDGNIVVVDLFGVFLEDHVFQNGSEFDCAEDFGLFFFAEVDAFSVASSLNVENSIASPNVLVVPN